MESKINQKHSLVVFLAIFFLIEFAEAQILLDNNTQATDPNPADGATYVQPDIILSWIQAPGIIYETIAFSDSVEDVNSTLPGGGVIVFGQEFDPGHLDPNKTYYWRIDEYDSGYNVTKGVVWSFTTWSSVPPSERTIVINEIMYDPAGEDAGNEWIELYNTGDSVKNLEGWTITNSTGNVLITLPDYNLPPDEYLIVNFGLGPQVMDLLDETDRYFINSLLFDANAGDFNNIKDEVALFNGIPDAGRILDFVAYNFDESSLNGEIEIGKAQEYAIAAGMWTSKQYVGASPSNSWMKKMMVLEGDSIGRDKDSTDSDLPSDWAETGGQDAISSTPGSINFHEVSFAEATPINTPLPEKEWTFMVYASGDTNSADPIGDLEHTNFLHIDKMEQVGSNENVNIVFQYDGFDRVHEITIKNGKRTPVPGTYGKTFRGYIMPEPNGVRDSSIVYLHPAIDGQYFLGEKNMADPDTLKEFLDWAMNNFPAKKYALVLNSHGGGWKGIVVDDTSYSDWLYMGELKKAISSHHLDIIGFDACLMAMIEVGCQVKGSADILVASECTIRKTGWPYNTILTDLKADPHCSGSEFATTIVEDFYTFYENSKEKSSCHTLSAVDLKGGAFNNLINLVNDFADDMLADAAQDESGGLEDYDFLFGIHYIPGDNVQISVKTSLWITETYYDRNFKDLSDLMKNINNNPAIPMVYKKECVPIIKSLAKGSGVIIAEKHGANHEKSHGLSIYFPMFQTRMAKINSTVRMYPFDIPWPSCETDTSTPLAIYATDETTEWGDVPDLHPLPETPDFDFSTSTLWDEFLHRYYKPAADAGEDQVVELPLGQNSVMVTLDGRGSSDADGYVTRYFWDLNPLINSDTDDWDRDNDDETDDDKDVEGKVVQVLLTEGTYEIVLTVWDNHNLNEGPTPYYYFFCHDAFVGDPNSYYTFDPNYPFEPNDPNDPNYPFNSYYPFDPCDPNALSGLVDHSKHWKTDQDTCIIEVVKYGTVIPTVYPQQETYCPEVQTYCPEVQTYCPEVQTYCPEQDTYCPEQETYCPPLETECPVVLTTCPDTQTICSSCPPTILPAQTYCPEEETSCPPVETQCPIEITTCPATETICTECPVTILPLQTYCPQEETYCPQYKTECPATQTLCAACQVTILPAQTYCPQEETHCPPAETQCPIEITLCPLSETICTGCPLTIVPAETYCPQEETYCPVYETECPPTETICTECQVTVYPCFETVLPECGLYQGRTNFYSDRICPAIDAICPTVISEDFLTKAMK